MLYLMCRAEFGFNSIGAIAHCWHSAVEFFVADKVLAA